MNIGLRVNNSLPNVAHSFLLGVGPHVKSKKTQSTIASIGVLMDLSDDVVFLVYTYCISFKGF